MEPILVALLALTIYLLVRSQRNLREARRVLHVNMTPTESNEVQSAETELSDTVSALVDTAPFGAILVSSDGRVIAANSAAHRLFSRPESGMVGRPLVEAIADMRVYEFVRGVTSGSETRLFDEHSLSSKSVSVTKLDGGEIWIGVADTSELMRLRRIRTEFVGNLSHELRTPITAIGLLAESMASQIDSGISDVRRIRSYVEKIETEAMHLGQMTNELLDLAKIESGEGMQMDDSVDLTSLISATLSRMEPYAASNRVVLLAVPPTGASASIRGNAERIGQALINLLQNAVKFSHSGGVVRVSTEWHATEVLVRVVDQGIGISSADIDRVFERFYKSDRSRTGRSGTGLGLAITRHIIEAHGGTVSVKSEPGEGSSFTISLPVDRAIRD